MTTEPRARTRRRKPSTPVVDEVEASAPVEEPLIAEQQPPEPDPNIVETTVTVISEEVEPLAPAPEPEPDIERTDFYFPPRPRADQWAESKAAFARAEKRRGRRASAASGGQAALRQTGRLLKGLGRTIQILTVFVARGIKRATFPALRGIWRWITVDPYAPPREQPSQSILQGHVLGVYRYQLYQRIILGILGGVPLTIAGLYIIYLIVNSLLYGIDGKLFLVQDLAGTFTGIFSGLMMLSLANTRITLRSDGIEYKTMFRVVRSRWEEISMLKVDYFRRSERWVVGTGRGAWAFLVRSLFGMPKGRQLAKLITIYARLSSTGTPYWLPSLGRFSESGPVSAKSTRKTKETAPVGAQQQAP
ncbi:MAG TPA: hypothetical protein VKT82_01275 [Ktedonobacterales bacterium]|nr:hypothetical protein [Ktedonobacterales bacterium]